MESKNLFGGVSDFMKKQLDKNAMSKKCDKYDLPHEKHGLLGCCLFCRVSAG